MGPGDIYVAWMVSNTSSKGQLRVSSFWQWHWSSIEGCDNEPVIKESKVEGAPKMEVFCEANNCIYSTFVCLPLLKLLCHRLRFSCTNHSLHCNHNFLWWCYVLFAPVIFQQTWQNESRACGVMWFSGSMQVIKGKRMALEFPFYSVWTILLHFCLCFILANTSTMCAWGYK